MLRYDNTQRLPEEMQATVLSTVQCGSAASSLSAFAYEQTGCSFVFPNAIQVSALCLFALLMQEGNSSKGGVEVR